MESATGRSFPHRIRHFPYLRSTRTLASFRHELDTEARIAAWLGHLGAADAAARRTELAQLPAAQRDRLERYAALSALPLSLPAGAQPHVILDKCRAVLLARDRSDSERLEQLRGSVVPDSEYSLMQRIGGVYPLTSLAVRSGVLRWHEEVRKTFADQDDRGTPADDLRRYVPGSVPEAGAASPGRLSIARDALDMPLPDEAQLNALYLRHAPVWEIETASAADLPGSPLWKRGRANPGVDSGEPVVYRYSSITRFRGRPRLQLNYLVWFDARPATGSLDMLAGRLDGVIWRVTLDEAGLPLVYDSVHPCGCYHLLFPVGDVVVRESALRLPEPPLIPATLPIPRAGTRVHLRLAAGTHYLERVTQQAIFETASIPYRFAERDALYATPDVAGGQRSLFGDHGLVDGSQRAERWFLWPTGVRSPGAMRERGRRATAFIGQRHFDDAFLLDQIFR